MKGATSRTYTKINEMGIIWFLKDWTLTLFFSDLQPIIPPLHPNIWNSKLMCCAVCSQLIYNFISAGSGECGLEEEWRICLFFSLLLYLP